jgi:hypothetical protein
MTSEELQTPRYKVIADYPHSPYKIGDIITFDQRLWINSDYKLADKSIDKYPHLFKKLEWHEEREPEEMPEYVKHKNGNVFKVSEVTPSGMILEGHFWVRFKNILPATKEQYEEYKLKQ